MQKQITREQMAAALQNIRLSTAQAQMLAQQKPAGPSPEEIYLEARRDTELQLQAQKIENVKTDLQIKQIDSTARHDYASKVYKLIRVWLVCLGVLLVWCGFPVEPWRLVLPSPVLVALVTTTNAAVLGLFVIVANYFFNRHKPPKEEQPKA